jgi:hypothetical protein
MALIGLLAEDGDLGPAVLEASRALQSATDRRLRLAQRAGTIRADVAIGEALSAAVGIALDGLRPR